MAKLSGFFPKFPSKEEKLEEKLLKTKSDFSNYQKRTVKQKDQWSSAGIERFLSELLPSLTFLDQAVVPNDNQSDELKNYLRGFQMINSQIQSSLEAQGVTKIFPLGEQLNPIKHEAIDTVSDETKKEDEIIKVTAPGYMLNDKVISHARVIVNKLNKEK